MRIGVISDPHGCLVGLHAAITWLEATGVDRIVCAGDVASFGPEANGCITLLAEKQIATAQGNCDRDMLRPLQTTPAHGDTRSAQIDAINAWSQDRLTPTSRAWLAALPPRLALAPGLLIVHGGLASPDEIVPPGAQPALPTGITIVAAGHLHTPFIAPTMTGIWANAGSAGRPCDGDPRAAVAVLKHGTGGWQASIHRIAFDLDAAVDAIHEAGMPYADRVAKTQVTAHWF